MQLGHIQFPVGSEHPKVHSVLLELEGSVHMDAPVEPGDGDEPDGCLGQEQEPLHVREPVGDWW